MRAMKVENDATDTLWNAVEDTASEVERTNEKGETVKETVRGVLVFQTLVLPAGITDPDEAMRLMINRQRLAASDGKMARASEDVINLLIDKGIIKQEDLPAQVDDLLNLRDNLRK